jgi:prolyl-tRNA editing enzyme YbaK/EbsC (Cys-tRNA(Pro) deacylase)
MGPKYVTRNQTDAGQRGALRELESRVPSPDPAGLVAAALDRLGVAHRVMPCDPAAADTAVFCERYGIAPEDSANTILVAIKREPRRYVACVVLATTRLDVNHKLREVLGEKRLSFADAEETVASTGMLVGGVAPFGLPDAVPVLVDGAVMDRPEIVLGGGSRDRKLRLAPRELQKLPGLRVVPGLAQPRGEGR